MNNDHDVALLRQVASRCGRLSEVTVKVENVQLVTVLAALNAAAAVHGGANTSLTTLAVLGSRHAAGGVAAGWEHELRKMSALESFQLSTDVLRDNVQLQQSFVECLRVLPRLKKVGLRHLLMHGQLTVSASNLDLVVCAN